MTLELWSVNTTGGCAEPGMEKRMSLMGRCSRRVSSGYGDDGEVRMSRSRIGRGGVVGLQSQSSWRKQRSRASELAQTTSLSQPLTAHRSNESAAWKPHASKRVNRRSHILLAHIFYARRTTCSKPSHRDWRDFSFTILLLSVLLLQHDNKLQGMLY